MDPPHQFPSPLHNSIKYNTPRKKRRKNFMSKNKLEEDPSRDVLPLSYNYSVKTHLGSRKENQDNYCIDSVDEKKIKLFGVFDGHGHFGMNSSKDASKLFLKHYKHLPLINQRNYKTIIVDGFRFINEVLENTARFKPVNFREFGTTASIVFINEMNTMYAGWVGDSRIVVFRPDKDNAYHVHFMSSDHNLARIEEKQRIERCNGRIVENKGSSRIFLPSSEVVHEKIIKERCVSLNLTRSLGHLEMRKYGVIPDPQLANPISLQFGDTIILATDGLWDLFSEKDIASFLSENNQLSANQLSGLLIQKSLKKDYSDNITIIVIRTIPTTSQSL